MVGLSITEATPSPSGLDLGPSSTLTSLPKAPIPAPLLSLRWDRADHLDLPAALARLRLTETPLFRLPPSAVIAKYHKIGAWPGSEVLASADAVSVALASDDFVLSGRIWTAFRTDCALSSSGEEEGLVVKIHVPAIADFGAMEEAAIEGWLYEHRLAHLDFIPVWYGMYAAAGRAGRGPIRILAAALEDAGEPMSPEEVGELTPSERGTIVTKYARLHALGVVHGSPKPKHWLRRPGEPISEIKIIDFGAARVLDGEDLPDELRRKGWLVLSAEEFKESVWDEYVDLMRALGL